MADAAYDIDAIVKQVLAGLRGGEAETFAEASKVTVGQADSVTNSRSNQM